MRNCCAYSGNRFMNTKNVENKAIVHVNNKQDTSAFHSSTPEQFSIFFRVVDSSTNLTFVAATIQ